jgi:hypothetical protein
MAEVGFGPPLTYLSVLLADFMSLVKYYFSALSVAHEMSAFARLDVGIPARGWQGTCGNMGVSSDPRERTIISTIKPGAENGVWRVTTNRL